MNDETMKPVTPLIAERVRRPNVTVFLALEDLAIRYRDDDALRARLDSGDVSETLTELGIQVHEDVKFRVAANSVDTFHVVLPPDPNTELSDESLVAVAGGKSAGSAGTVGSAGTFACACSPSTVSTAGSAGTAGSAS